MSNCYCCLFCESWCKVTANERNGKRNCFLLHFRMPRKLFKVTANGRKDKTFCIFYNAIVQLVLIPFILLLLKKVCLSVFKQMAIEIFFSYYSTFIEFFLSNIF